MVNEVNLQNHEGFLLSPLLNRRTKAPIAAPWSPASGSPKRIGLLGAGISDLACCFLAPFLERGLAASYMRDKKNENDCYST